MLRKFFFAGLLLVPTALFATDDAPQTAFFDGALGELTTNAERTIEENLLYSSTANQEQLFKIKNYIYFKVEEGTGIYIQDDFNATVNFTLYYTNLAGVENHSDYSLTVNYTKAGGTSYERLKYFYFEDAKRMRVVINSVNGSVAWNYKAFLSLKLELIAVRDYKFNCGNAPTLTTPQPMPLSLPSGVQQPDDLMLNWSITAGNFPTEYDIEWAWIDKSAEENYKTSGGAWIPSAIFQNNATRVTVSKDSSHYRIPLLYDDEGYVFYRIRYTQTKENGQRLEGAWTSGTDYYSFSGHHPELNWQASTTYAEDGKRKSVVNYADGTSRSRQTVTKDNVDGNTIVAETIYDFQGRPAIQVLPAPTLIDVISYTKNFNRIVTGTGVSPVDFDELNINSGDRVCAKQTAPLLTESGASRYYSTANDNKTQGLNRFIPDAEGYPYTETRYASDGTGRVAEQGGVGAQYQVGTQHSTKYFYGVPDQRELDGLFGTDVGYASHYFKNMVRDANGQYSISYVDMHGRTVATALAGNAPDNLKPLNNDPGRNLTYTLLDKHNNRAKGNVIESVKSLVIPQTGVYTFNYTLGALKLEIDNCDDQSVCYECMYDLEITITDECTTPGAPNGQPVVHTYQNLQMASPAHNHDCNTSHPFNINFQETLNEGSYTFTKRLIISKQSQDYYREAFLQNNNCKTLQEFTDYYINLYSAQGNCKPTCTECEAALGSYTTFRSAFLEGTTLTTEEIAAMEPQIQAAYDEAKAHCATICGEEGAGSLLEEIKAAMNNDLTPGIGQYAMLEETNRPYNIFNPSICNGQRFRHPLNADGTPGQYLDENGSPDPINSELSTITAQEFADRFKESWVAQLLPYHPEYKKLIAADPALAASYEFDGKMLGIETWQGAVAEYNMNPIATDPYFNGVGLADKTTMLNKINVDDDGVLTDYGDGNPRQLSLWQKAYMIEVCTRDGDLDFTLFNSMPALPPTSVTNCVGDWDAVWQRFALLYQNAKDQLVYEYLTPANPTEGCTVAANSFSQNAPSDARLLEHGFVPHFTSASNMAASHPSVPQTNQEAYVNTQIDQNYSAQCESYIASWETKLLQCPAIAALPDGTGPGTRQALLDKITDRLKDICTDNSDENHPYGSSSNAANTQSFQQVIVEELGIAGISLDNFCHEYLIDFPPPYNLYPSTGTEVIYSTERDDCFCDKLDDIITENNGLTGLLGFIERKYGTTMTQSHLDSLLALCNHEYENCRNLPNPLVIPPALQCSVTAEVCKTCDQIETLTSAFQTANGSQPYADPSSDAEVAYNIKYEKYMNINTGFNKKWTEYVNFLATCDQPGQFTCDQLKTLLQNYYASHGNTAYGPDCRADFTTWFNAQTGSSLTFSDIMALFQEECGFIPDVCEIKLDCKKFQEIIKQFYLAYGNQVADGSTNCQQTFVNFFNSSFNVPLSYTWAELVAFYQKTCKRTLDVCSKYPASRLQDLKNDYLAGYPNRWLMDSCQQRFVEYFNYETESSLTYPQVLDLYNELSISLDICTPPVQCSQLQALRDSLAQAPVPITNCDSVTVKVNQRFGLNLTTNQFFQLYAMVCNIPQRPCGDTILNCGILVRIVADYQDSIASNPPVDLCAAFVAYYNTVMGTSLTEQQIVDIYFNYCGAAPSVCKGSMGSLSCEQLTMIKGDFLTIYPQPGLILGTYCTSVFVDFFNFRAGTNFTDFTQLVSLYEDCNKTLTDISNGLLTQCEQLQDFLDDFTGKYASISMPRPVCRDLFVSLYNRRFAPAQYMFWTDIAAAYDTCNITLTICPLVPVVQDSATMQAIARAYVDGLSDEGRVSGCEQRFATFYNQYMGSNYSWGQLATMYEDSTGGVPLVCGNVLTTDTAVLRTFMPAVPGPTGQLLCGLNQTLFPEVYVSGPDPCQYIQDLALTMAEEQYQIYLDQLKASFDAQYYQKCKSAKDFESFTVSANGIKEYHYTLYYYDQAGNLVRTVPPEGVERIADDVLNQFDDIRNVDPLTCTGEGIPTSENATVTFNGLSTDISTNAAKSAEMWLYSTNATDAKQVRVVTPDNKYFVQAAIKDAKLWVEIYSLTPGSSQTEISLSNQAVADLSGFTWQQNWAHLFVQSAGGLTGGTLELYFNGQLLTNLTSSIPNYPFEWEITASSVPANDITVLKHLRTYNAVATASQVLANARNYCLAPVGELATGGSYLIRWGRFNIPAAGTASTTGPGSTNEWASQSLVPAHRMTTEYRYNTLNQVSEQKSPDAGISKFWYDKLGRLSYSQNAKQQPLNKYSYTTYDALGRIAEVGQITNSTPLTQTIAQTPSQVSSWRTFLVSLTAEQITKTVYDLPQTSPDLCTPPGLLCQKNLRNRVSYTLVTPTYTYSNNSINYSNATYYSYDIHGNVDVLLQHYNDGIMNSTTGNAFKKIEYNYDLISGKVNNVAYQRGFADQFYHRYRYDGENRIKKVQTSADGVVWEEDVRYAYYRHGPLARMELGDLSVQGVDYAYTLQGWLKGVNSTAVNSTFDMGGDGSSTSIVAKDVYGFALHYNNTDYAAINTNAFATMSSSVLNVFRPLYNGNIGAMSVNIDQFNKPLLYNYYYDQLNRLTAMDAYTGFANSTNSWTSGPVHTDEYRERISYDGNGNILKYGRNALAQGGDGIPMDSLTYNYNLDSRGKLVNNRLRHVDDEILTANTADIEDQNPDNYGYDAIGNLTKDTKEGIGTDGITWNVYGKIATFTKTVSGVTTSIAYTYDASGNRIGKSVMVGSRATVHTWYVRDAIGNIMALYEDNNPAINNSDLSLVEVYLYGTARLGLWVGNKNVVNLGLSTPVSIDGLSSGILLNGIKRGVKLFELSNHLGNLLGTISDKKIGGENDADGNIDSYLADLTTANDYFPGGMDIPGRTFSVRDQYRFGFNGKERDCEGPVQYDYGFRIYDPRVMRFKSVDPLTQSYPWFTPYQFAGNSPILNIDLDGLENAPSQPNTSGNHTETTQAEREAMIATLQKRIKETEEDINRLKQLDKRNDVLKKNAVKLSERIGQHNKAVTESVSNFKKRAENLRESIRQSDEEIKKKIDEINNSSFIAYINPVEDVEAYISLQSKVTQQKGLLKATVPLYGVQVGGNLTNGGFHDQIGPKNTYVAVSLDVLEVRAMADAGAIRRGELGFDNRALITVRKTPPTLTIIEGKLQIDALSAGENIKLGGRAVLETQKIPVIGISVEVAVGARVIFKEPQVYKDFKKLIGF